MKPKRKRETVEMVDGRVYFSDDGWETVWRVQRSGRMTRSRLADKDEADLARFLAMMAEAHT